MAQGNKLYPLGIAFYVRGDNPKSLRANVNQLNALLLPNGLQPILQEADLLALDSYMRNLPMAYDVSMDKSSPPLAVGLLQSYRQSVTHVRPIEGNRSSRLGLLQSWRRTLDLRSVAPGRPQEKRPYADPRSHRSRQVSTPGLPAATDGGGVPPAHLHNRGRWIFFTVGSALPGPRRPPSTRSP